MQGFFRDVEGEYSADVSNMDLQDIKAKAYLKQGAGFLEESDSEEDDTVDRKHKRVRKA